MNKKETVQALETKWGVKAAYLGAPSFAYELKTAEQTFIIDRHGVVMDLQGREINVEAVCDAPQMEPANGLVPTEPSEMQVDGYAVEFPLADHTGASLRNLVNMLSSKQKLIASAFALPHLLMDPLFAEELSRKNTESVELFQESFLTLGADRCQGLGLDDKTRTVALKLTKAELSSEEMAAFRDLAVSINQNALKLKTSSFRPTQDENPKYGFRTWLIRLGMNGDEFKTTRKVLLARLGGSGSFRSSKAKATEEEV